MFPFPNPQAVLGKGKHAPQGLGWGNMSCRVREGEHALGG